MYTYHNKPTQSPSIRSVTLCCLLNKMASAAQADVYRVLVLGESGVGKTSLVQQYMFNVYNADGPPAERDEEIKTVRFKNGQAVSLKICDTAGQERADLLTANFYRGTDAIVFVYDITNSRTLWHSEDWIQDWKKWIENFHSIPVLFVGNKSDVKRPSPVAPDDDEDTVPADDSDREDNDETTGVRDFVDRRQVKRILTQHNFITTPLECSARTGDGVRKVFETIAAHVAKVKPPQPKPCVCL